MITDINTINENNDEEYICNSCYLAELVESAWLHSNKARHLLEEAAEMRHGLTHSKPEVLVQLKALRGYGSTIHSKAKILIRHV